MSCECENYCTCKKDYSWNPSPRICDNRKHFKSITGTTVSEWDKNIIVVNNVPTNKTIAANVRSTVSINCHNIKEEIVIFCTLFL